MKTIEQVSKYISSCLFNDNDWNKVLDLCREQYGGGKVHRPKRGVYQTSYADFSVWLNHMPGQGDIVAYNKLVGIVGKCTSSDYILYAYTGLNGNLIQKELVVSPMRLRTASTKETSNFKGLMAEAKVYYSERLGMLIDMYVPANGEFVRVKQNGKIRFGIFDHADDIAYWFYYLDNKDNNTKPSSIRFTDCELESASSKECVELHANFARMGIMWNPREKQFLNVPLKAPLGGKYWYVNDKFYVCQANDTQTPVHKERYNNGNYFTSYSEALVFIQKLKDLRMELNKGFDL